MIGRDGRTLEPSDNHFLQRIPLVMRMPRRHLPRWGVRADGACDHVHGMRPPRATTVARLAGSKGRQDALGGVSWCNLSPHGWCGTIAGPASNHEESMGCVAAALFDQAIFPIEISLHRARGDIGALIGRPAPVPRTRLWPNLRRPRFQPAIIATLEHIGPPPHLREPGRSHVGAD